MSKEIIIDDVDVAGCKNFISVYTEDEDIEINNCCTLTYTPCQFEKKDCYYKQLIRLQAENERLKKRQIIKNGFICDCEQNVKYRQALEEISRRVQLENADDCLLDVMEIIDEVLDD